MGRNVRRVALLFSGGPAPGANAVIASAATALRRAGREVVGIMHGYEALQVYDAAERPLVEGEHYRILGERDLQGLRHRRGVTLGTARAHPGRGIHTPADLDDPAKTERLRRTWQGLVDLGVEALVSIGGDGTLMTAAVLHTWQQGLPADAPRVRVVHVPKTIDNDYRGIDFTFGFFTAVDVLAKELLNLRADALATNRFYVAECMGRSAGWLAYAAAVAGEAHMVFGVEDVVGLLAEREQETDPATGETVTRTYLSVDHLVERVVDLVLAREAKQKRYGVVVLAEGLVELLPPRLLASLPRGDQGELSLPALQVGRMIAERAEERYHQRTGRRKRVVGLQLGYEARCAPAHAFDVLLGSQLGVGAARAVLEKQDAVMVSIQGQLELRCVPFSDLIDPQTFRTEVRYIQRDSDFFRLAHSLETVVPERTMQE